MPRNVRNFWLSVNIDGKQQKLASGPVKKDGGFDLKILLRENGEISNKKVLIQGNSYEGKNTLLINFENLYIQPICIKLDR